MALRWQRLALVHLPAVLWALFVEFRPGTLCSLTALEKTLRQRGGKLSYTGVFIDHYIGKLV